LTNETTNDVGEWLFISTFSGTASNQKKHLSLASLDQSDYDVSELGPDCESKSQISIFGL